MSTDQTPPEGEQTAANEAAAKKAADKAAKKAAKEAAAKAAAEAAAGDTPPAAAPAERLAVIAADRVRIDNRDFAPGEVIGHIDTDVNLRRLGTLMHLGKVIAQAVPAGPG